MAGVPPPPGTGSLSQAPAGTLGLFLDTEHMMLSPSPSQNSSACSSPVRRATPPLPVPLDKKIVIGVCAMDKKTQSKPMTYILDRIRSFGEFEVVIFGDQVILEQPIEAWPIVDCLIAFFSSGFPLAKVEEYVKLRKPFMINDLAKQHVLLDRKATYQLLQQHGVPVPRHIIYDESEGKTLIEGEDYVELDGVKINKPFVEKPLSGEDHNIYIYYPKSAGGGSKRLFRKVDNRSSDFYPDVHTIRKTGSYIYEEFMPTGGTDLKVYTVGPDYAHAEARKSPVVDGRVQRDSLGKEIRYPVILTSTEKEIARVVVKAFGQLVCGFDLLRSSHDNTSVVCDVNGWSFVKNSKKYYEDCAQLLRLICIQEIAPERFIRSLWEQDVRNSFASEEIDVSPLALSPSPKRSPSRTRMEVRCVVAVIRHGDRTPKQKLKMRICQHTRVEKLLELFEKHGNKDKPKQELKLKTAVELQDVLDVARSLLIEMEMSSTPRPASVNEADHEALRKLGQVKSVLEKGGYFSGINRKVQMKPLKWRTVEDAATNTKTEKVTEALFILKWGGQLTDLGIAQSQALGSRFRLTMYPGEDGLLRLHSTYRHDLKVYTSDEGRVQVTSAAFAKSFLNLEGGLTPILVSLVRKDKYSHSLLDDSSPAAADLDKAKEKLFEIMNRNVDLTDEVIAKLVPTKSSSLIRSLQSIRNPFKTLCRAHELIKSLTAQLDKMLREGSSVMPSQEETLTLMQRRWKKLEEDFFNAKKNTFDISKVPDVYDCIHYDLIHNSHLQLQNAEELYAIARDLTGFVVPQEYGIEADDKLKIGVKICGPLLRKVWHDLKGESVPSSAGSSLSSSRQELPGLKAAALAGTGTSSSNSEGSHRLDPRHAKGAIDLRRHVRTRLYFTSESHIHSLLNVLRFGPLVTAASPVSETPVLSPRHQADASQPESSESQSAAKEAQPVLATIIAPEALKKIDMIGQLNYLTHIVFKVYENFEVDENDPARFPVELLLSSGAKEFASSAASAGAPSAKTFPVSSMFRLNNRLTLAQCEEFFSTLLASNEETAE